MVGDPFGGAGRPTPEDRGLGNDPPGRRAREEILLLRLRSQGGDVTAGPRMQTRLLGARQRGAVGKGALRDDRGGIHSERPGQDGPRLGQLSAGVVEVGDNLGAFALHAHAIEPRGFTLLLDEHPPPSAGKGRADGDALLRVGTDRAGRLQAGGEGLSRRQRDPDSRRSLRLWG